MPNLTQSILLISIVLRATVRSMQLFWPLGWWFLQKCFGYWVDIESLMAKSKYRSIMLALLWSRKFTAPSITRITRQPDGPNP